MPTARRARLRGTKRTVAGGLTLNDLITSLAVLFIIILTTRFWRFWDKDIYKFCNPVEVLGSNRLWESLNQCSQERQKLKTNQPNTCQKGDSQFRTSSSGVKVKRRKIKRPTEFRTGPTSDFKTSTKDSRFLSLFTVVQFGNDGCQASTGDNGTCLTSSECAARGGVANGPCAKTFGVCCLFTSTCGQTTSQNCTYFVNPGYPTAYDGTGSCQLTIQKAHPDVCQYRIDFDQFTLSGPEPINNVCNNDQFIVSGGNPVPGICGVNNGNHMYIDAGTGINNPVTLTVVTSGPTFAKNWKMKICQVPCSSNYRESMRARTDTSDLPSPVTETR